MITYEWNCRTVDVYPEKNGKQNVIYNVHYQVSGEHSENAFRGDFIGTQLLDTEGIEKFTNFGSVTHSTVVGWVKNILGPEKVAQIEAAIEKQINEQETPSSITVTIED